MIARLASWLDQRLGAARAAEAGAGKVFPEHWSFLLGEIAFYAFVVLVASGTFLAMFFDSSLVPITYEGSYAPLHGAEVTPAFASVLDISFDVPAGLLVRQVHHWAALVFVAAIVVHLLRIFFTGAFRRPREVNWLVGVTLLGLAILEGFAGYSLPDDLLSGTGLRVGYSITQSVPVVGDHLAFLVWGGEYPGTEIASRLFIGHVWILPAVMGALIAGHLLLVVRQKHTQFPGPRRTEDNVVGERLWPTYLAKSVGLLFLVTGVMVLLGTLFQVNPVWLYGPYDPAAVTTGAQPDWYMGWLEGALRLTPSVAFRGFGVEVPNVFLPGVLLPGLTFAGLYAYPFVEQWWTGAADREHHLLQRPRDHPHRTAFGVAVVTFYVSLFVGGSNDVLVAQTGWDIAVVINVMRAMVVVLPLVAWWVTRRLCRQLQADDVHAGQVERIRERVPDA
ncbi:cytochrome b [Salsipaludibacter albus]|uniref:cytochrome bc1 complex cytochrome b subunit n=1 Tax=Salsipaludibacter albus TaxID=2849650 RepID=UPI001EE43F93